MADTPHPGNSRLAAYLAGDLRVAELEQIEDHLSSCVNCRADFLGLNEPLDSFLSCLRIEGAAEPPMPGLQRVLEAAARLPVRTTPGQVGSLLMIAGRELVHEIGRGGLGVVYLVRHPRLGALQAVKRPLSEDQQIEKQVWARFQREVRAIGQLEHDHIVRALDANNDEDGPYLVLEYLDGMPLNKLFKPDKGLSVADACELVRQAALGLQHAHEKGLVHRDIKPGNLMLARRNTLDARVVIIDWGLARLTGDPTPDDNLTSIGTAMGTPDYMAPEQARDARSVDIRADIYALGVTLYALLAGKPPFAGMNNMEKMVAHQSRTFPPLSRLDVAPALLALIDQLTQKDPALRPSTPGQVAKALAPFCLERACLGALLGDLVAVPEPTTRRRFLKFAGVVAGGVVLSGVSIGAIRTLLSPGKSTSTVMTGPKRLTEQHQGHCSSIQITPDGRRAVSESGGRDVVVWDLVNYCRERTWDEWVAPAVFPDVSGIIALSPDGSRLAAGGLTALKAIPAIKLWNLDGKPLNDHFANVEYGRGLAFSPDNSCLAMVEVFGRLEFLRLIGSSKVVVYDLKPRRPYSLPVNTALSCLMFSPDGATLAMGDGPVLKLWEWRTGGSRSWVGHNETIDAVAFTPDGRVFTTSLTDRTARIWKDGKPQTVISDLGTNLEAVAIAPIAERVVVGSRGGEVIVWNLKNCKEVYRHKDESAVTAVALSSDGRKVLSCHIDRRVWLHELSG
ncbi:MAG: twin-arginine translocation signal domain-containing protein [Planctomycetia bacterium]|nr:twin-arginine translocation signal domain-containing protein [Planctomycetia bacterium]